MWQMLRKKAEMVTADRALPGRAQRAFPVPAEHYVNGNRILEPFPAGLECGLCGAVGARQQRQSRHPNGQLGRRAHYPGRGQRER